VAETLGKAFRLSTDGTRHGQEAFTASPFSRLLITHVLSLGGDALVTLALAGSIFFSTDPHAARGRVALTLLLTIAPFAVVAPLLGPMVDKIKGGRRAMVIGTALGRVLACFLMARYINSFFLFPAALLTLVCSKGYVVAKATLVPSAVQSPKDLVEANSKLAVSGAVAGFLIAIPGVAVLKLAGARWVLWLDMFVFLACAVSALRLQVTAKGTAAAGPAFGDTAVLTGDPGSVDGRDVRVKPLPPGTIQVAAYAMGTLRLVVGFLTFLVAFAFRGSKGHPGAPAWWYGVVLICSLGGNLVGAAVAPWLRTRVREEMILAGTTIAVAATGVVALFLGGVNPRPAVALLAGVVGFGAGAAKLAFDSQVQRYLPASSQGRAFGRFEAGFQLVWVVGGLVPVVIPMSLPTGFLIVTLAAVLAAVVYIFGTRQARLGRLPDWWPGVRPPRPPRPPRPVRTGSVDGPSATDPTIAFPETPGGGTPWSALPAAAEDYQPWLDTTIDGRDLGGSIPGSTTGDPGPIPFPSSDGKTERLPLQPPIERGPVPAPAGEAYSFPASGPAGGGPVPGPDGAASRFPGSAAGGPASAPDGAASRLPGSAAGGPVPGPDGAAYAFLPPGPADRGHGPRPVPPPLSGPPPWAIPATPEPPADPSPTDPQE
jgi:MFS family permease